MRERVRAFTINGVVKYYLKLRMKKRKSERARELSIKQEEEKNECHLMEHVKFYIYYNQNTFYRKERTRTLVLLIAQYHSWFSILDAVLCVHAFVRITVVFLLLSLLLLLIPFIVVVSLRLPCSLIHIMLITSFFTLDVHTFRFISFFCPHQFSIQSSDCLPFRFLLSFC